MLSRPLSSGVPRLSVVQGYNPTVDYLRVVAALIIVQFHARAPLGFLGESAVAFFVICMVWFTLRSLSSEKQRTTAAIKFRIKKLMYPFWVWGLITLTCKLMQVALTNGDPLVEIQQFIPPNGSFAQLWFLPWAAVVTLFLFYGINKLHTQLDDSRKFTFLFITLALGSILFLEIWSYEKLPLIIRLSALYLPSVGVGVSIFLLRESVNSMLLAALGICIFGLLLMMSGFEGYQQFLISPLLMVGSLIVKTPKFYWTKYLGQISMDIYLVHIIIIAVVYTLPGFAPHTVIGSILITLVSIAVSVFFQLSSVGRWVR